MRVCTHAARSHAAHRAGGLAQLHLRHPPLALHSSKGRVLSCRAGTTHCTCARSYPPPSSTRRHPTPSPRCSCAPTLPVRSTPAAHRPSTHAALQGGGAACCQRPQRAGMQCCCLLPVLLHQGAHRLCPLDMSVDTYLALDCLCRHHADPAAPRERRLAHQGEAGARVLPLPPPHRQAHRAAQLVGPGRRRCSGGGGASPPSACARLLAPAPVPLLPREPPQRC